ncbi:UNVERIFIED_CONTAM: hypothetical protein POV78_06915 [Enterobacter roggenkampii]
MTKFTKEQCGICAECVPQINGGSGFTNCADAHAAETAGDKMPFTKEQLIELTREDVEFWRERDELIPSMQTAMRLRQTEIALAALTAPPVPTHLELLAWVNEDSLPENYPYDALFPFSKVDIVRMFPVYGPAPALVTTEDFDTWFGKVLQPAMMLNGIRTAEQKMVYSSTQLAWSAAILAVAPKQESE